MIGFTPVETENKITCFKPENNCLAEISDQTCKEFHFLASTSIAPQNSQQTHTNKNWDVVFIPLLLISNRENISPSFGGNILGSSETLCHETTGQDRLISLKTFNSTVQHNLCERLLKVQHSALLHLSVSSSSFGFNRLTLSTVCVTILTTDVSSSAGEMLLKGSSHRYLWFSLKFAPVDCHNLPLE